MSDNSTNSGISGRQKSAELAVPRPTEEGYIRLPFNSDQFKEFIQSLLGSPQAITKTVTGCFELDSGSLINVHRLLLQRVQQQNEAVLAKFEAKIVFSDESSVQLNSVEEFSTYNELKPVACNAVHLTWDILVRFQDKDVPEKQRIQFSAVVGSRTVNEGQATISIPPRVRVQITSDPYMQFRIEHTARTWGADIEALLTNHIYSLLKNVSPLRSFLIKRSGLVGFSVFAILLINFAIAGYIAYQRTLSERALQVHALLAENQQTDLHTLHKKLDFLLYSLANNRWSDPANSGAVTLVALVGLIVSIIAGIWVASTANNQPSSHLLLTRKSQEQLTEMRRRESNTWTSFCISVAACVIIGVVSNFVFAKLYSL